MWNKKGIGKSLLVLTIIFSVTCQIKTMAAPALTVKGLNAGVDTVITASPSSILNITASSDDKTASAAQTVISIDPSQLSVSDDSQPVDEASDGASASAEEPVSFTAGAGALVTASLAVAPEDMDVQEYEEEEAAGAAYGYTNLGVVQVDDHLNVRQTAQEDSKIVGKMENDTGCEILGVENGMAHITSGSVEGYVSLDYILMGDAAVKRAASIVKELATVNADGLKLREQPSTDAPVYDMVSYGEELEVLEKTDGWVGVDFDGQKLYVSADYVTVDTKLKTALNMSEFLYGAGVSDVRVELCEYAKEFIGNPYVWGGTSLTKGADCSGFVLSVFAKYGISLPHSSRAQKNCGTSISMSEAKPGDLIFYAKGGRINHVAIYIGGGQVVMASSPKTGIRIASAYYRTPVAVTRVLQD